MKKQILAIFIVLSCLFTSVTLQAEEASDTTETTTIVDEETPEKGVRKSQNPTIPLLTLTIGILGIYGYILTQRKKDVDLQVTYACRNDDGSMTVSLGYKNPRNEKIQIEKNKVNVTHGTAIILNNEDIEVLDPGKHDNVVTAVITEDTNLNWNINDKSISVDGQKILKKGR